MKSLNVMRSLFFGNSFLSPVTVAFWKSLYSSVSSQSWIFGTRCRNNAFSFLGSDQYLIFCCTAIHKWWINSILVFQMKQQQQSELKLYFTLHARTFQTFYNIINLNGLFLIYDVLKHARSGLVRFIGPCECDTNDLISLLSTIGNIRFKAKELWRWMNPF